MRNIYIPLCLLLSTVSAFWDEGSTTVPNNRADASSVRRGRFRWQKSESNWLGWLYPWWDWAELTFRRRLYVVAGVSHKFLNLATGAILNRRTIVTAANYLDPYMDRQRELRIWALGRNGYHDAPWRYRAWRVIRLVSKSMNPEHCHGPFCYHSPRHDVAIIQTLDQMYLFDPISQRYAYASRAYVPHKYHQLVWDDDLWFAGSGFEYLQHIYENYKIFFAKTACEFVVDCSKYLPKWWGKFICVRNHKNFPGLQNGGPLLDGNLVVGIGCFEIRYNDDRILVFTDLRYYTDWLYYHAYIRPGEYYEYAYPAWGVHFGIMEYSDNAGNDPQIPHWQKKEDLEMG